MHTRSRHVYHHFLVIFGLWVLVITVLVFTEYRHQDQNVKNIATAEALSYLNKQEATRNWAAARGGVYVPITEETPPNPFLSHVPERDIISPGGQNLTLMNPAYMTRHMMDQYAAQYDVRGHITSLKPTRPETAPDAWERSALAAFAAGARQVAEITTIEGRSYLRIMKPLMAEGSCLKCHSSQVDNVGDIRGGVGVALPMDAYRGQFRKAMVSHGLSLGVLWLLGSMGLGFATWKLSSVMKKHDQAESLLRADEQQLKRLLSRLFHYQEIERKTVAMQIHEEIAQSLGATRRHIEILLLDDQQPPTHLTDRLETIIGQLDGIVRLARQVTKRISPILLDDLGIKTAVLSLCRDAMCAGTCMRIETDITMDENLVQNDLKIVVYRILEELLSLSSRHCHDGRCSISLRTSSEKLVLEVQLRGASPDMLKTLPGDELSIDVARNRAVTSGAAFIIASDEGGIITIRSCWPLGETGQQQKW